MDAKKVDSPTVEERLAKLERQNRRLKIVGAVALVLMGAMVLEWAAMPTVTDYSTSDFKFKTVTAQEVIVVDAKGKPQAGLTVEKDGATLMLLDEKGTPRATLGVDRAGATLVLLDEKGMHRAVLDVDRDGPRLGLFDAKGTPRAGLDVLKDKPGLVLVDEKGETIWHAPPPDDAPDEAEADGE